MKFIYGRQDMPTLLRAQENCYLQGNGLGGYSSLSAAYSMTRGDQGLLVGARTAPNDRVTLIARTQETLKCASGEVFLSTQQFAEDQPAEDGFSRLSSFVAEDTARWSYDVRGVRVTRETAMAFERNTLSLLYTVENRTAAPCTLTIRPMALGFEKGHTPLKPWSIALKDGCIHTGDQLIHVQTDGLLTPEVPAFSLQYYMHDEPDGRPEKGLVGSVCRIALTAAPGEKKTLRIVFSDAPCSDRAEDIIAARRQRMQALRELSGLKDETALQLVCAADAYVARRESTSGKTILAGYPFFGDWGRDTMIALPGCTLSAGRCEDAKSILRTFFTYEKDGLVPNLFPEGTQEPMYNTVDAALLLINTVWLYVRKTGDLDFAREAWPVMEHIVDSYRKGTHHGIRMDKDGLICAGKGLDQVTWMDVRVGEILPTPRHGKPVEINAYWYSALRIMDALAKELHTDGRDYALLAETVKESFLRLFWMEERRCLKDVISGTGADEQIRCNQIWAVTQPFTMLDAEQERAVADAVYSHLYTPCGLRTLSPDDAQYHGTYEGVQKERDMAYHQGTGWVFPLGAYYLAYLKTRGSTPEAARAVREALEPMAAALREGCAGQLPEIYNGDSPSFSRGCFAQAWSVGEILRVYEALEAIEA
ncbi:MAG: glycogen debranching enzyme N-terminal domain-containing protein [Clostridia bacterium]|nr:glycogen debranching enzyme N-terminal domain-containing protein [Clostridia bacterium]